MRMNASTQGRARNGVDARHLYEQDMSDNATALDSGSLPRRVCDCPSTAKLLENCIATSMTPA